MMATGWGSTDGTTESDIFAGIDFNWGLTDATTEPDIFAGVSAAPEGTDTLLTGSIKRSGDKFGFVIVDNGPDLFVMPVQCKGFGGRIPPIGTRVRFEIGVDPQKGNPCANNVQPEHGSPDGNSGLADKSTWAASESQTGSIKRSSDKFGFILVDTGEDLFVMPAQCTGFGGQIPPMGTRVRFSVGLDPQKGSPIANNVQPEHDAGSAAGWESAPPEDLESEIQRVMGKVSGVVKDNRGNCGFIKQDSDATDMFVLPKQCVGFGGAIPPVGTAVIYSVVPDEKSGRPRAEDVQPLDLLWDELGAGKGDGKGSGSERGLKRSFDAMNGIAPPEHYGTMKRHMGEGKCGYIGQDSGESDIFVMPFQCPAFSNALPPIGARVAYTIGVEKQKGLPCAENVRPLRPAMAPMQASHVMAESGTANQRSWQPGGQQLSGAIKENRGNLGFIFQDSGERDMFVMPAQCDGGILPPAGTRVVYTIGVDPKSQRPRAENVRQEVDGLQKRIADLRGKMLSAPSQANTSLVVPMQHVAPAMDKGAGKGKPVSVSMGVATGSIKENRGNHGFILQDSGDRDMFVMPAQCDAFGGELPPVGTPVCYEIVADPKTMRPRAENVQPNFDGLATQAAQPPHQEQGVNLQRQANSGMQMQGGWPQQGTPDTLMAGSVKQSGDKYGFILQDSGEPDMFMMPMQCEAFGGICPPVGTRVVYSSGFDAKTGKPIATNVGPEDFLSQFFADEPPAKRANIVVPPLRNAQNGHKVESAFLQADRSGSVKKHNGKCGFILQDSGEADMFVMPAQCIGFGKQLPPMGTRVVYSIGIDKQKQSPMAENVQPEQSFNQSWQAPVANNVSSSSSFDPSQFKTGAIKQSGKFGFILQDDGEPDMFVLPLQCELFNNTVPELGTRVAYTVGQDAKNGRPRAFNVVPEEAFFELGTT